MLVVSPARRITAEVGGDCRDASPRNGTRTHGGDPSALALRQHQPVRHPLCAASAPPLHRLHNLLVLMQTALPPGSPVCLVHIFRFAPRHESELVVANAPRNGSFLVRDSESVRGACVLSVRWVVATLREQ